MHSFLSSVLGAFVWLARRAGAARIACLCGAALLFVAGCERPSGPPLIEVTELAPRAIESGDRLELRGTGFPQGRTGRVELRGTLFRAGEPPVRGARIDVEGVVNAPDRLELVVTDELAERLCGRSVRATHTTFRGDVAVSFASTSAEAPPLVGVLRDATLDVLASSVHTRSLEEREAEGSRVLAFLGIVPGMPSARGLPIEDVGAGTPAERSGIEAGDVLTAVDGVHVLSVGDVIPSATRTVELSIRRGASGAEASKTVPLIGFSSERIPAEYAPALVVLGLALAVLLMLASPGPASVVALEMRIAAVLRKRSVRTLARALFGTGPQASLSVLASAAIAAFALTPYVVGPEIDAPILLVAASSALIGSRVVVAHGLAASLRTALEIGLAALAMAAAVTLAVGQVGAVELPEIVRLQGGAPWRFSAMQRPACALLGAVYAAAVVSVLRTRPTSVDAVVEPVVPSRAVLLERAGVLLASALAVMVFLGGWQLPGIGLPRGRVLMLVSAVVLVAKTWIVAGLFLAARRVAMRWGASDAARFVLKRLVPGLVVATGAVAATRYIVPSLAVETAFGATVVALGAVFCLRMTARVHAVLSRPEPHASPFL